MLEDARRLRHDLQSSIFSIDGMAELIATSLPRVLDTTRISMDERVAQLVGRLPPPATAADTAAPTSTAGFTDADLDGLDPTTRRWLLDVAEVLEWVSHLRRAATTLSRLAYARTALRDEEKQPLHAHQIINDLVQARRLAFRRHGGEITADLAAPAHTIRGDAGAFTSIISNLADNALTAAHDRPCHVHITTTNNNEQALVITVHDDGPGIPHDIINAIFEPGVSTTGSGLGLAYARRAAELHDGIISVTDTGDAGTTFTITIPTVPDEATGEQPNPPVPTRARPRQERANLRNKTVLVVDDDLSLRVLLQAVLRRMGAAVELAADGQDALAKLTPPPDLLVLDLLMPTVTGFDVLEYLRVHEPALLARTLVFTAAPPRVDALLGDLAVIHKPFDLDQFMEVLEGCLDAPPRTLAPLHEWQQRLRREKPRSRRAATDERTDGEHRFTSDTARVAGRKGGEAISRDRAHMSAIGRKGAEAKAARTGKSRSPKR
jgi:CheY-like chemotaxis protein/two-component sensor histidine kinase/general stress protein YciG